MNRKERHIIFNTLHSMHASSKIIREQEESQSNYSFFTDIEKAFLGKFDTNQSKHLGIIYSLTDIGIREFMQRSGAQLNCTPGLLLTLIRKNIIKLVPSGGYGSNTDYTIELQISLNDIKGFGQDQKQDGAAASGDTDSDTGGGATGGGGGGGFGGGADLGGGDLGGGDLGGDLGGEDLGGDESPAEEGAEEEPPDLEGDPTEWVVNYKDIINESTKIAKRLINERSSKKKTSVNDVELYKSKLRIIQRVPVEFTNQLKRVIAMMNKKTFNKLDQERLIADIIDILQLNFDLTQQQIHRAYEFHRNQKRLQKYLEK